MKRIRFEPSVPSEVRAIERDTARRILQALHRYAESGEGDVKALKGDRKGLKRLRVGDYRVLFDENTEAITVHRVRDRKDVYR